MHAVDAKIADMMEKTMAFQSKFQTQEDIIEEMVAKFRKETREARSFINKYEEARDQFQDIQNDIQIDLNLFKAEMRAKKEAPPEKVTLNPNGDEPEQLSTMS